MERQDLRNELKDSTQKRQRKNQTGNERSREGAVS